MAPGMTLCSHCENWISHDEKINHSCIDQNDDMKSLLVIEWAKKILSDMKKSSTGKYDMKEGNENVREKDQEAKRIIG